ncbi:MAG: FUSC family protein [Actinomycetes bacterium]
MMAVPAPLTTAARRLRAAVVHLGARPLQPALAAAIAWLLCTTLVDSPIPVLGSIAALVTVDATVFRTVRTGLQQASGAILGLVAALIAGEVVGLHAWSIGLVVLIGVVLANTRRLGAVTGTQLPTTAILVMALGRNYGLTRVIDTAIGVGVGIAVQVVWPADPVATARTGVAAIAEAMSKVYTAMAEESRDGWGEAEAQSWMSRARGLDKPLRESQSALEKARESLRWNVWARVRSGVAGLEAAGQACDHLVGQVRSVARTLVEVPQGREELEPLPEALRAALAAAGATLAAFAEEIRRAGPGAWPVAAEAVAGHVQDVEARVKELRESELHEDLQGAIVDLTRLTRELAADGAHGPRKPSG